MQKLVNAALYNANDLPEVKKIVESFERFDVNVAALVALARYIKKRKENNDISKIISVARSDICPIVYNLHQHCQPTNTFVKRNFFMLRKLSVKNRNIRIENVKLDFTF